MTGNVLLDVVISLSFLYALYSLFATVIMELIITSIGLRAWNLQFAIYRMLRDREAYKTTKKGGRRMMSRIEGIFQDIWIRMIIALRLGFNPETTSKKFKRRQEKLDLFIAFYDQPSVKYLSEGGLFTRPSYIPASTFSKALMDLLKAGSIGDTPLEKIQQGIESIPEVNRETRRHIQSLLTDAGNDLQKFRLLLERWYNDTQERAVGWFKRKTQLILLVLGLTMSTAFDLNTVAVVEKLSVDKDARDKMVEMAIAYSQTYENSQIDDIDYKGKLDSLNATRLRLEDEIRKANSSVGLAEATILAPWQAGFWCRFYQNFIGLFLTSLAISLGAPFWFDLLNKFVKLRSAVQQPVNNNPQAQAKGNSGGVLDREG